MTTSPPDFENFQRETLIRDLAKKSLFCGIASILCCGMIFGPLAISYSNRTDAAIIEVDTGRDYGSLHRTGRTLGYIGIGLWILGMLIRVINAVSS